MRLEGTLEEIARRLLETAKARDAAGLPSSRATLLVEESESEAPDDFEKELSKLQAEHSVFVPNADWSRDATHTSATPEEMQRILDSMEPYLAASGNADDSREAIYTRRDDE